MSRKIRFVMVGGFLGAGKTTTLGRLATHYVGEGKRVAVVTNDQASDLVDTNTLRSQGFNVGEVAGACFCCNFDELMDVTSKLSADEQPDVILAEPVGSCTDLVATVLQPLRQLYDAEFEIAPYAVIVKPSHGLRILRGESGSGFSPKAEYILRKQLEEADAILINRIDELDPAEVDELAGLIDRQFEGRPILRVSALTGDGFDGLLEFLSQKGDFGRRILDIDYDIYAEGEAELGWLNMSARLAGEKVPLDDFLLDLVTDLRDRLQAGGFEPAHLKTIGLWEGFFGVANLVSSDSPPLLSLASNSEVDACDLIVNARVACDPETLTEYCNASLAAVAERYGATLDVRQTQSFRPGRPVPTHRMTTAV